MPFYIWVIGFINAEFFIPFFKADDANDFLEAHGYEFVNFEEIKNDGRHRLEENRFNKWYSSKTYYEITVVSILDHSEKKIRLILKKTYIPLLSKRTLYFFE